MAHVTKQIERKMRAVIAAVMANAKFYDQNQFPEEEDCGSVCCAAGFVVWVEVGQKKYEAMVKEHSDTDWWVNKAESILGISTANLFWTASCWPDKFYCQYLDADTPRQRALAMKARWEFYIKNGW